jgi:hypothetical protein
LAYAVYCLLLMLISIYDSNVIFIYLGELRFSSFTALNCWVIDKYSSIFMSRNII